MDDIGVVIPEPVAEEQEDFFTTTISASTDSVPPYLPADSSEPCMLMYQCPIIVLFEDAPENLDSRHVESECEIGKNSGSKVCSPSTSDAQLTNLAWWHSSDKGNIY
jgi:hypothetical protein